MAMENLTDTVRVGVICNPYSEWATEAENGTMWHGHFIYYLRELQKYWNLDFEFVEMDAHNHTANFIGTVL